MLRSPVERQRLPSDHQRNAICQLHEHPRGARVLLLPRNPPVATSTLETFSRPAGRTLQVSNIPKVTKGQKIRRGCESYDFGMSEPLSMKIAVTPNVDRYYGIGQAGRQIVVLASCGGDLPYSVQPYPSPFCKPSRLAAKTLKHIQIADSILNISLFLKLLILGNFHELQGVASQRQDDGHTQETTQKGGHGQNQPAGGGVLQQKSFQTQSSQTYKLSKSKAKNHKKKRSKHKICATQLISPSNRSCLQKSSETAGQPSIGATFKAQSIPNSATFTCREC